MSIPLLSYAPSSQNQRVSGFEISGDDQPRIFTTANLLDASGMNDLIMAAYRQIFHEQQMLTFNRQTFLESQLRSGQITVREFIRGLVTSDIFRSQNYNVNNNYRFVQICVHRILGREIYSDREKMAWSIVLATEGLHGFVDALLNSEEYLDAFGDDIVPYQRRRTLPQRTQGELPFERMPRYDADHLATLNALGNDFARATVDSGSWLPPEGARKVGAILTYAGAAVLLGGFISVAVACFGLISL